MAEFNGPAKDGRRAIRRACLLIALGIGAITPLFEIGRALIWQRTLPNYGQTLVEQQRGYRPPHYLGRLDVPTLKALFRTPSPVPAGPARRAMMPAP